MSMYSYEELPENREYFYGSSVPMISTEYPNEHGAYGCGYFRGFQRSHSQRMIPNTYFPYGREREFIPSRQTRYLNLIGLCEEDGTVPYDLNGTGTKISPRLVQREFVSSPPHENMHSYYPPLRQCEVKYEESYNMPPEIMPSIDYEDKEIVNERKRKFEEESDFDFPMNGWKLPASKSPIMEAMVFCAIQRWGLEISHSQDQTDDSPAKVVFKVLDFEKYYKYSCAICSKQNPTEDLGSRVKSLRRWFVNFPKKRDRRENPQFTLEVKPDVAKKVYEMIEKYKCQINVKKRRRTL
jgi:hypothetical protein